jgi:hypothetical protein
MSRFNETHVSPCVAIFQVRATEGGFIRSVSIFDLKRGALFRPTPPLIIDPRRRDVRVPKPLLDLRDIGVMCEGICRRGRPERVHAEAVHVDGDARDFAVVLDHIIIHRLGVERLAKLARRVVLHGAKEGAFQVLPMR